MSVLSPPAPQAGPVDRVLSGRLKALSGGRHYQPSLVIVAECDRCRMGHIHGVGYAESYDALAAGPLHRTAHCRCQGSRTYRIELDPESADADRATFAEYQARLADWHARRRIRSAN
jgi:hypothetical protein